MQSDKRAVIIVSGGMDSATLLYSYLKRRRIENLIALSFNYGQRHSKELEFAKELCELNHVGHTIVDLTNLRTILSGSVLTDMNREVPDGHYTQENMKETVVPNRNMIMLSIAVGAAVTAKAGEVGIGVHAGDHFIYPDCRPAFIDRMLLAIRTATEGFGDIHLHAPFLYSSKSDIARLGHSLGVPYELTWSCYKGGAVHCGRCGTCVERQEAFKNAGVKDPTIYEDSEFWKGEVAKHA